MYDVYGIGNALVDTEFEVSEDFLKEQKIEKGCMSLLDAEGHQSLSKILRKEFEVKKVAGAANPADMMTKHLGREKLQTYMKMIDQEETKGKRRRL